MGGQIPTGAIRFEPGYTFDQALSASEFSQDNILVGGLPRAEGVEGFLLGKVAEYQLMRKNVWLDCEGAHAVYVMGKRRSGKTYTLGVLVEGLAAQGWIRQGERRQAIVVVDTMNIFLTMPHDVWSVFGSKGRYADELAKWSLHKEEYSVILYYPRGTPRPPEGVTREVAIRPCELTGNDWAALFEVDTYADPMGQLITELYEKVALEGYDANDGTHIQAKPGYGIDDLLNCLDRAADILPPRYEQRTIEAIRRRLNAVGRMDIFSEQATDIPALFSPGQVSVLLLRDLDHSVRALLVAILVKRIMQLRSLSDKYERLAAVHRSRYESLRDKDPAAAKSSEAQLHAYTEEAKKGLPRGWLVIDEAHNYMPARGIVASSEPLKKYVNEGRNLGLSIVVATQNPSGLDPSIRRNADVLIIHSISMRDDIAAAEGMVNTFVPDSFQVGRTKIQSRIFEQLLRSLPQGYAVLSNDRIDRVLVVKVRPRLTVHGGIEY